ncbi:MAG: M48 family metallopeptidase [Acidobacteria bacterium]|nr:M48 family metallopeptidase [Acidobacteriota bacterium]
MSDATGFIAEQRRNRRGSVIILAGTFALLFIVANLITVLFGGYTKETCTPARVTATGYVVTPSSCVSEFRFNAVALIVTIVVVGGYLIIAWYASASAALTMVQARPAEGPEYAELRNLVEQMSIASGIPVPRTYVVDDAAPNAFATGRDPNHAAITVTTGLLAVMSRRELRGVLAHEMAHIRNRDIAVTTLAVLAVGAIAVIAQIALRIGMFGGMRRRGDNNGFALLLLLSLAIYLLAVPAGLLLKASLSRKRESLADATAVELTREPSGLRSALEKLEADTTVIANPSAATAHLWIESPLERSRDDGLLGSFGRMMDTHPPLADRIATLRAIEGLDPEGRGPNDPFPTGA